MYREFGFTFYTQKIMKPDELYKNWEESKDRIKNKIVELTEDDLLFSADQKDEMYGKLQINTEKPEPGLTTPVIEL